MMTRTITSKQKGGEAGKMEKYERYRKGQEKREGECEGEEEVTNNKTRRTIEHTRKNTQ